MRVATFNVHHCEGRDGVMDVERTAKVITTTGASLVGLQELDQGMARTGGVDQPALLQDLTGMTVLFFPTLRRGPGRFGVGIACTESLEAEFRPLPHEPRQEPRGVIVARWNRITVLSTHLATELEPRLRQTRALAEAAAAETGPTVVMGDLNQTFPTLKPLVEAGFTGPVEAAPTFGWRSRRRQIDFVLAGPGLKVTEWKPVPSDASDHLALVASVKRV